MKSPLSIYLHWPYCLKKCGYCAFNKYIDLNPDLHRLQRAFRAEISQLLRLTASSDRRIKSIYFGGGTPSLAPPWIIESIMSAISEDAKVDSWTEKLESSKLCNFKSAGINRVSIGIQSLNDKDLETLGRQHSVKEALHAIDVSRALFPGRVSIDLIYGRPTQTPKQWQLELHKAIPLLDNHVSIYQLSIENGTPFHEKYTAADPVWRDQLPSHNETADMYLMTNDVLAQAGFERYEVSSYGRRGPDAGASTRSVHNMAYWDGSDYLGIGPGAHGRFWTAGGHCVRAVQEPVPEKWMALNEDTRRANVQSIPGARKVSILDEKEILNEMIFMGLRTVDGLSLKHLRDRSRQLNLKEWKDTGMEMSRIEDYVDLKLMEMTPTHLRCTQEGLNVLDAILARISPS